MSAKDLLEQLYSQNGNDPQDALTEHVGVSSGGICDCDSGECCSPGRTI